MYEIYEWPVQSDHDAMVKRVADRDEAERWVAVQKSRGSTSKFYIEGPRLNPCD
jgi:hypothetical protein